MSGHQGDRRKTEFAASVNASPSTLYTASSNVATEHAAGGGDAFDPNAVTTNEKKSLKHMMKNAEIVRLRRFLLPVLYLKNYRRRRELNRRDVSFIRPDAAAIARHLQTQCTHLSRWPLDILQELAGNAVFRCAFEGEPLSYEDEPVSTHGLMVLFRGTVGVMPDAEAIRGEQMRRVMENGGRVEKDSFVKGCPRGLTPTEVLTAPTVLGELLCLTDGINGHMVRAIDITHYAFINVAAIRTMINTRLSPSVLAVTFSKEVRMARKATLQRYFHQTLPLMLQCWVCGEMSEEEVEAISEKLTPEVAIPGEDIVVQGAAASTMYFIRRGQAVVVAGGKSVAVLSAGRSFGEMGLLFHERRMTTVRALTVCDLWVLSKSALDHVIGSSPAKPRIIATAATQRTQMIAANPRDLAVEALSKQPVLQGVPLDAITKLITVAKAQVFPAGSVMIAASTFADRLIVIQNGHATSQDVFCDRYDSGDAIGTLCVRLHRNFATVAATVMVDAFVIPRHTFVDVLRKCGFLSRVVEAAEQCLMRESSRRGVDVLLTRIPHYAFFVKRPDAPSPTSGGMVESKPHRTSIAEAKQQRYHQTDITLQRNAGMMLNAKQLADREAAWLLSSEDAATKVAAPDVAKHEAVIASIEQHLIPGPTRRGASNRRGGGGDGFQKGDEALKHLMSVDDRFVVDLAHMPSHRHMGYSELSKRTVNRRKKIPSDQASLPSPRPLASVPSATGMGDSSNTKPDDVKLEPPQRFRDYQVRPLYHALHPNSYAPVLPQSVQPLTPSELDRLPTSSSEFGPVVTETVMVAHPPPQRDERRFVPTTEEMDEIMAEILGNAAGEVSTAARKYEMEREEPRTVKDRDYVAESWDDINAQIVLEKPVSHIIYIPNEEPPAPPPQRFLGRSTLSRYDTEDADAAQFDGTARMARSAVVVHEAEASSATESPAVLPALTPRRSVPASVQRLHTTGAQRGGAPYFVPSRPVTIHDKSALQSLTSPRRVTLPSAAQTLTRRALAAIHTSGTTVPNAAHDTSPLPPTRQQGSLLASVQSTPPKALITRFANGHMAIVPAPSTAR